jgi:hypothetical protein
VNRLAAIGLIVAGIIHLLPSIGMLGPERLQGLYGVAMDDPNLAILMRHRALLFTLLGAFLVAAAFRPAWRGLALAAGYASVLGFFGFAWATPDYNAQIARVVTGDWIALAGLAVATVGHYAGPRGAR